MVKKRAKEIKEEIEKKGTRGKAMADADGKLESNPATAYTAAGDRITPYEADEDLGEKGNMRE